MLSEPQTTKTLSASTAGSAVATLPRTSFGTNAGVFATADGTTKLSVSHQYGKRTRRSVRLDFSSIVADPLVSGLSTLQTASVYVVIDHPPAVFSQGTLKGYVENLATWIVEGSFANTLKWLGGEA